ncbi:MAG: glutamate synthase-related protein [Nitrososphaerota archaeon]|nr:glutamate synthase-related protein [Nitrososphaerota archaeon]
METRNTASGNVFKERYYRYHIDVRDASWKIRLPKKFRVKIYNNCVNIQECVQACVYNVHRVGEDSRLAEPLEELCRGCHRCTLVCPKGAICIELNPEFQKLGDSYFTPERIENLFFEAETGRIPVSGAGYGGDFAGRGFNGFWFDFSEIVRPTRDGIHGREYISTTVDLGRKPHSLVFRGSQLVSEFPRLIELPIPIILDSPLYSSSGRNLSLVLARTANKLGTLSIIEAEDYFDGLKPYIFNLMPRIRPNGMMDYPQLIKYSRIVELDYREEMISEDEMKADLRYVRELNPSIIVCARFSSVNGMVCNAEIAVRSGVDIIHIHVDDRSVKHDPDIIVDTIRRVHSHLVENRIRDEVSLVSSGGIAEAAHVPKSIILGADAVAIGLVYQIVLGCRVCYGDKHRDDCQMNVEEADIGLASQRIVNLISSWRDQLLEVLGGMGLREVRRLRGELGRAIFYRELEEKVFGDSE